jgi:hypothetical protein
VLLLTVKQWFLNKTIEKYQMYMPLVIALYSLTTPYVPHGRMRQKQGRGPGRNPSTCD